MKKSTKPNPLKFFNDERAKRVTKLTKKSDGGPTDDYKKKVAAGQKAGWKVDQPGAYKAGLTDTASVTYLRKGKEFAGVKKPKNK